MGNTFRAVRLHQLVKDTLMKRFDGHVMSNKSRGDFVECLIGIALGPGWRLAWTGADEWAAWDCQHHNGARVQIKQAAARQSWDKGATPKRHPSFDIRPRKSYREVRNGRWAKVRAPGRQADLYIFARHSETRERHADHGMAGQWEFFVVPEKDLPRDRKSIGLKALNRLASPCRFEDLRREVERVYPAQADASASRT